MYNKNTKLELKELPPRAEELSPSEIHNVFGGCGQIGANCNKNSDCCEKDSIACGHDNKCYDSSNSGGGGGMF